MPAHRKDFVYRIITAAGRKNREALRDISVIVILPELFPTHGTVRPDFQRRTERRVDNVYVRGIAPECETLLNVPCLCVGRKDQEHRAGDRDYDCYNCF